MDALHNLPSFCRVAADLRPTPDSDIRIEVWLPTAQWNGKFFAVGSGGSGGSLSYGEMADALRRGYATSATDDGHTGPSASFVVGHPEKLIDFAYRAEHEMIVEAKTLIRSFYDRDRRYSFWSGCSGGGREGLLQASAIRMNSTASPAIRQTSAETPGRSSLLFRLLRIPKPISHRRSIQ